MADRPNNDEVTDAGLAGTRDLQPLDGTQPPSGTPAARTEPEPVTAPLPVVGDAAPLDAGAVPPADPVAPRKRRRLRGWLIALVVLAILVVVAWFVGDNLARDYAKSYIRTQLITSFDLPADQQMDITIGPGSLIAQAIRGSIDSVDVDLADVALGDIDGDVSLALTGIPLSATQPVETLRVKLTVDEANVKNLGSYLSEAGNLDITLDPGEVRIGTTFTLLTLEFPVSVGLIPSVVDGGLEFAPTDISVNDSSVSLSDLANGPLGGLAGGLLATQSYCVAEYLPTAITLTDVAVTGDALVITASGDGAALGGPEMTDSGTCP